MTKRLLHIVATPRGLASHTGRISGVLLEELHAKHADLDVHTLDLFSADLPAVAGVNIKTKYALMTGQPVDEAARGRGAASSGPSRSSSPPTSTS
jgi:FMN-dependent NADH-azoreductase